MKKTSAIFLVALYLGAASAEVLPDQVDLKASYCIPIARSRSSIAIEDSYPANIKSSLTAIRDKGAVNLRRLNLYLLPRLSQLELTAVLAASKSADEDLLRIREEVGECFKKAANEVERCVAAETDAFKRIKSCDDVAFLPF